MRALPAPPAAPFNSAMNGEELRRYASLDREGQRLLQLAFSNAPNGQKFHTCTILPPGPTRL